MKLATVFALIGVASACGGGSDDRSESAGSNLESQSSASSAAGATSDAKRKTLLQEAAQGYVDALISGDGAGAGAYLDKELCDDDDAGTLLLAANYYKETAKGSEMSVRGVYLNGDRGGISDYKFSGDAPAAFQRLVKESAKDPDNKNSWIWRTDDWYLAGPCEREEGEASPAATAP